ncbi:MAG TPA: carboxypeptidase-like regulatory domain-containing protein, partial [Spirochaetota bacterium]|nr:carboxypeptidase-like regulatory domain-containing protein [Spirochaetota bacterium]
MSGIVSRAFYGGQVSYYNIRISGYKFSPITDMVSSSELSKRVFTVPAIKNVTVEVEFLNKSKQPVAGSARICGYTDVLKNANSEVEISVAKTAVACVINELISLGNNVLTFNPASLQAAVDAKMTDKNFNPLAVDAKSVAQLINSGQTASVLMYPRVDVTGKVVLATGEGVKSVNVSVNEPTRNDSNLFTDTAGQFTIANVAPGNWLIMSSGGSASVNVGTDGTFSPNPVVITADRNPPVIYSANATVTDINGLKTTKIILKVDDLDGTDDVNTAVLTMPEGSVPSTYSMAYNAANGEFSVSMNSDIAAGEYVFSVADKAGLTTVYKKTFTALSPVAAAIISPSNNEKIAVNTPTIKWNKITGVSSYSCVIKRVSDGKVFLSQSVSGTEVTSPELEPQYDYLITVNAAMTDSAGVYRKYEFSSTFRIEPPVEPGQAGGMTVNTGSPQCFVGMNGGAITLYDMATSSSRVIYKGGDTVSLLDISPDGTNILFKEFSAFWRIRINGTGKFRLTSFTSDYISGRWAPDGKKVILG